MGELANYSESKKPDIKGHTFHDSIYMEYPELARLYLLITENRLVVLRALGPRRGMGRVG